MPPATLTTISNASKPCKWRKRNRLNKFEPYDNLLLARDDMVLIERRSDMADWADVDRRRKAINAIYARLPIENTTGSENIEQALRRPKGKSRNK